jgi:hypothetical protein
VRRSQHVTAGALAMHAGIKMTGRKGVRTKIIAPAA